MNAVENDGRLPRRQQPAFSVGVAVRGVTALNTRSSPHRNSLPVPLRALVRLREDRDCTRCNEQLCRPAWKLLTYVQVVERPGWVLAFQITHTVCNRVYPCRGYTAIKGSSSKRIPTNSLIGLLSSRKGQRMNGLRSDSFLFPQIIASERLTSS